MTNSHTNPRTIVITGATRGLGRALTQGFINQGHSVIGCGRSPDALDALAEKHALPNKFTCLDVTDTAQVKA